MSELKYYWVVSQRESGEVAPSILVQRESQLEKPVGSWAMGLSSEIPQTFDSQLHQNQPNGQLFQVFFSFLEHLILAQALSGSHI